MKNRRAFSLLEALIVVAVIGIVASLGGVVFSHVVTSARDQKLQSDVDSLNRSVLAYLGAGGDLSAASSPEEVLSALKSRMSHASRVPTLSGSKVDERLTFVLQSAEEAGRKTRRAYWDGDAGRFVLASSGSAPGIKSFVLDDTLVNQGTEDENSRASMLYAAKDSWIWDYQELPAAVPAGPSAMPLTEVPDTVATPAPPGSGPVGLTPLASPTFSIPSGVFPITSFDLPLSLSNPNPAGSSELFYSIDFGNWKAYTGPLSVPPGSLVAAQAISLSDLYSDSGRVDQSYDFIPGTLIAPVISPDRPEMGLFTGRVIHVTLIEQNPSSLATMQYKVGDEPWTDYTGPFPLNRDDYPGGALVQARAVPLNDHYTPSTTSLRTLGVEAAVVTGAAEGSFSNPVGEKDMVSNLNNGGSSNYFEWGLDTAPGHMKSWLDFSAADFHSVAAGERFQIGTLDYYNGTIAGGTAADHITFTANLNFDMNGVNASTAFDFDFDLINVPNRNDPNDPWADADYVQLADPMASQTITFQGIEFLFQLEFGETSANGISHFDEFHVLEGHSSSTKLYGTLIEIGSVNFNQ